MKHSILLAAISFTLFFSDCNQSRQVQRIDPNQVIDLSGRWNDVDAKLVAAEMTKDVLTRPWKSVYEAKYNKKPTVIVGQIKNKTSEHIDATNFIKNIEREFINSGTVSVVQSGDASYGLSCDMCIVDDYGRYHLCWFFGELCVK